MILVPNSMNVHILYIHTVMYLNQESWVGKLLIVKLVITKTIYIVSTFKLVPHGACMKCLCTHLYEHITYQTLLFVYIFRLCTQYFSIQFIIRTADIFMCLTIFCYSIASDCSVRDFCVISPYYALFIYFIHTKKKQPTTFHDRQQNFSRITTH